MSPGDHSEYLRHIRIGFLCVTSFLVVACHGVTPVEERIVGTWESKGLDTVSRVVFRRDHVVVILFPNSETQPATWWASARGTWRMEGNEIVTDEKMLPIPGYSPFPARVTRIPIREFEERRLVRADGRPDFNRVRMEVERYSQMLALIYVIASLIALSAAIYAIRNTSFRIEFGLLVTAAACALAWSSATLVAELAQTGEFIMSPGSLRSLRVPTEILRGACILVFLIGFVKLALALRTKPAKQAD